ncbi:MAG: response regulator [Terriglobales bacterium]|jgi:CheY-like chemotaxis protein
MSEKATILCVDDDPAVLYTMKLILERAGFEVLAATDIPAAVSAVTEHAVDLVILDCLPNRASLVEETRRRRPNAPMLLLTGDLEKSEETDLDGILHKPVPPRELIHTISDWLAKRAPKTEN